jgi:CRP-like cAMP-binding protein
MGPSKSKGLEDLLDARRGEVEILLATDIFQDLTPAALGGLLPAVKRRHLNRGEFFYRAGETFTHLWVLISGQAKGLIPSPDGDETVLDVIRPGQLFGLPGLLSTTTERIGSSVATEPCVALSIEGKALSAFLERHPAAMRRTLARLADLVREYAEAMMLAAHEDHLGDALGRQHLRLPSHGRRGCAGGG